MKFRPCIDIHNGAVKQIVGGSLKDAGNAAVENYISRQDADYYATMYKKDGLTGGPAGPAEKGSRERASGTGSQLPEAREQLLYCNQQMADIY